MDAIDPLVKALIDLCGREGDFKNVADKAKVSSDNLWQIINGTKLPSGNPRGVGPGLRGKLSAAYPDWLTPRQRLPPVNGGPAHTNEPARSSLKAGEHDLDAALKTLRSHLAGVSAGRRASLVGLLTDLVNNPDDEQILGSIKSMLDSQTFVQQKHFKS